MEPEMIWLPDAVCIKQEPQIDIKEEQFVDEPRETRYNAMETKQEELDFDLKHEDNALISEDDNLIIKRTSGVLNSSGYSGDTSLTIPILQYEHTSESYISQSEGDISQHKEANFCNITLKNHTLNPTEHFTESSSPDVQTVKNKRRKKNCQQICTICNKCFTGDWFLNRHMRTHTGQRPYSCEICNKSFTERAVLNAHLRTHTGQRPYTCEICNKTFTQRGNLKTHMVTHTGQRPYPCELCNKSFSQRGERKVHMLIHTGERPYSCEICNKSFTQRGDLNRHTLTHTGQRPFPCEICNKSFTRRVYLNTHILTHIGK